MCALCDDSSAKSGADIFPFIFTLILYIRYILLHFLLSSRVRNDDDDDNHIVAHGDARLSSKKKDIARINEKKKKKKKTTKTTIGRHLWIGTNVRQE